MMSLGLDLLRRLGSGLTPNGAEKPSKGLGGADPAALSFTEMLAKAEKGEINSGLPVTIAKGSGVELSDEQLARVAIAADRAQAAGADRAVVIIDNVAVKLDVATRTISGKAELQPGSTLADIDAVVMAPAPAGGPSASQQAVTSLSASGSTNASLLDVLAKREKAA